MKQENMADNSSTIIANYLRYNKIHTGIPGLDKLLYDGLVIPYQSNQHILIVIRGDDDLGKIVFSLQLLHAIGGTFKSNGLPNVIAHYYSNYIEENYVYDLQLDVLISSVVKKMIERDVSGKGFDGNDITTFFFNTGGLVGKENEFSTIDKIPMGLIKENSDKMICKEALYYNARTNSLHFRMSSSNNTCSDAVNVIYKRKYEKLNDYLNDERLTDIEKKIGINFVKTEVHRFKKCDQIVLEDKSKTDLICFNYSSQPITDENREKTHADLAQWMQKIKDKFKIGIVVLKSDMDFPTEKADLILEMSKKCYESYEYLIYNIEITKSLFQMTALGQHQYKRRDYGIEVYPSLPLYCMQRRYLQRALVYTHSNVLLETYQQYLDNTNGEKLYSEYIKEVDHISDKYFNALHPTSFKKVSVHQVMDRVFINPNKSNYTNKTGSKPEKNLSEKEFLYGSDAGVTAVVGEANAYKRFLTFGSAFSSAHKHEHTLFLLLNKDDKIVRRRLLCPARENKCNIDECKECYRYLHFMNILMGCITPEEFLFYIMRQIEIEYPDGKIKRVIIDDLQVVDYCFPLLFQDTLFLPALIDECRNHGIALYILCDKNASLVKSLRSLADNIVCMERNSEGKTNVFVERYAGYHTTPSKIFAGEISRMENLFECYEKGSYENRRSFFNFDSDTIKEEKAYSLNKYWSVNNTGHV